MFYALLRGPASDTRANQTSETSAHDALSAGVVPAYVSAASIWQIAIKRAQGKLNAPENLLDERLLGHVQPVRRARKSTSAPVARSG